MKYKFIRAVSALLIFITAVFCGCANNQPVKGVWWWNSQLDISTYLDFAKENGVTEIYYCDWSFGDKTKEFLTECQKKSVSIYLLDGNCKWLTDSGKRQNLFNKLDNLLEFTKQGYRVKGVHLDIEPHQCEQWGENTRASLIKELILLANSLKEKYPSLSFNYDIPFWFDDQIEFNGAVKPAYAHMIDLADRVTVMSYRDTAEKIYSVGEDEIKYAKSVGKGINLSVETGEGEDIITFFEEGKIYMKEQLLRLRELIPEEVGIALHHIEDWKNLKD